MGGKDYTSHNAPWWAVWGERAMGPLFFLFGACMMPKFVVGLLHTWGGLSSEV